MANFDLSDYAVTDDLARATTIPNRWYLEPDFLTVHHFHTLLARSLKDDTRGDGLT